VAAKSITIVGESAFVLDALDRYAAGEGGEAERGPLQNGTRVRLRGRSLSLSLNLYPSRSGGCKIVFDQPESPHADAIAALLQATPSKVKASKSAGAAIEPVLADVACWVGSDESGKGDYFGPLVVAAVALTQANWRVLEALGVQDSKNLTDRRALDLALQVANAFPNEVIVVMPPRYNQLWSKFGNVNRLLAWAHARAIENVIERAPEATAAVADQFGDESLIRNALFARGREVRLVQMHRAERDPAVAAASILARAEFLRRLEWIGRDVGARLPKGASAQVEATGRALVSSHGPEVLERVAKRHFKTTQRVL
jgi:ribonuclease HIII